MLASKYEQTTPALLIFCRAKTTGTLKYQFRGEDPKISLHAKFQPIGVVKWPRFFEKVRKLQTVALKSYVRGCLILSLYSGKNSWT